MSTPKVSVIIPAYNGADFLGEAIQSVLDQTYQNSEIVIVDDASTDGTAAVVRQFDDPRIKYLVQEVNQGPDAARLLGIRSSSGDILALLDQDDLFHPNKLRTHVDFLEEHPKIGLVYNSRFELNHSENTIREIWRPPQEINLSDLILGFPICPSDMVLRRIWAQYLDLSWEPSLMHGGEYVINGRLFMSGCRFGSIDRALNYRRYHSGRRLSKLYARCESELAAQQRIFNDPRCPAEVLALRDTAFMNTYRIWAYYALAQDQTAIGQELLREAVRLKPSIIEGTPCKLVEHLLICSIDDKNQNHETHLKRIFAQLPPEMMRISPQYCWAVARGHLLRSAREFVWGDHEDAQRCFNNAVEIGAQTDEAFILILAYNLMNYETEFGADAANATLQRLTERLEKLGNRAVAQSLKGCYSASQAFNCYRAGKYKSVPKKVMRAIASDPAFLTNRGLISILLRSITYLRFTW